MFDDEEEELELLRQYEEKVPDESEDDAHSSDEIDSDLEEKIMSMVQYGSGLVKKNVPMSQGTEKKAVVDEHKESQEPEVVHAPVDLSKSKKADFSFTNELQLNDSDLEEGQVRSGESNESENSDVDDSTSKEDAQDDAVMAEPQITNYISLDDQQPKYMDDVATTDEEAELNLDLQKLIDDQISNRQSLSSARHRNRTIRVCFSCNQPGHERKDCTVCMTCGAPKHGNDNRCSGLRYCTNCKLRGHLNFECENDTCKSNCRLCNMSYHHWSCCPSLVHVYTNEIPPKRIPQAYCYSCAQKGHYGDECPRRSYYLSEMPSVFSKLSLERGSRFDPKKTMRESASSFSKYQNSHQRWSDSSRESSPRREYSNDRGKQRGNQSYTDDSDDGYSRRKKRKNDYSNEKEKGYKYKYTSALDQYFDKGKKNGGNSKGSGSNTKGGVTKKSSSTSKHSGNSNWKSLKQNFLPQPTRSGIVNVNTSNNNKQSQGYEADFPRGGGLPRPSSSGVIDLTDDSISAGKRAPKYRGGYKRNR